MYKFKGFKECQSKYMDDTMEKFEKKKLKISGKRIVKDRKQAVAIGLNYAQRKCKYSKKDYNDIKEKVKEFLYSDDRKISDSRVPLTNVIETRVLFDHYIKNDKKSKATRLKNDLMKRIVDAGKNGIKITKNIFQEIDKML